MTTLDDDEIRRRLLHCFLAVFPDLTEEAAPQASATTVASWDSVAAVTLMNVVQEDFGLEIDLDELAVLDSFAGYEGYLREHLRVAR